MAEIQNAMEIFKLLDKSNCRKCNEATCLAFAGAVFKGARRLSDCPTLDPAVVAKYEGSSSRGTALDAEAEESLAELQRQVESVDLASAAARLGGTHTNGKMTLKIMGKDVSVDAQGQFYTDLHVHGWLAVPVLRYILEGQGQTPTGSWVPFRELDGGKDWYRLYGQRCEAPLKRIADIYTDLFEDLVHPFNGRQVGGHFDADISLVLQPLPLVPLLVCYWKPDDGIGSDLHLFFDTTAEANLPIEGLYTLAAGLVQMFEKIALRHG